MRGSQIEKGTTFLIPLVCLLPAQVAWNTDPDTYAAAKRIVINVQVSAEVRDPRGNHACMLALKPIGFSMHTNLVGSAAAFFAKAVKSLKSWEQTLAPGVIQGLALKYNLLNLGDTILNLMHTTHLFKPKGRRAQDIPRDMDTFPPPEITPERSNAYGSNSNPNNANERNSINTPPMEWPPLGRHRQSPQDHQGVDHNRHCCEPSGKPPQARDQYELTSKSPASVTYAHVLRSTNRLATQDHRAYPVATSPTSSHQPYSNTPSPTISSLSGSSVVSSARSALLTVLKPSTSQARTSTCVPQEQGPPPEWQTAMTAISITIKDTMNLFTAYLKSNPPARGAQQANYRNSKKNADRRRKRRDRNQPG